MATLNTDSASETVQHPAGFADVLEYLYAPIQDELEEVRQRYRQELSSDDPAVADLLHSIEHYSGKMLRPALLLLAAKACGHVRPAHILLAAVGELIHTATLVHDDILDQALLRRQRPSLNHLAGAEVSVLLGDHLFSHALELALTLDNPAGAHRFSRAVSRTCQGEITQVYHRGSFAIDTDTYYRILRGKTAELYATCCEIGGIYADASAEQAEALYNYGMNLGIAFQIMDDVLDLRGEEEVVGKTLGTDLSNGKATLPLIHYLSSLDEEQRALSIEKLKCCSTTEDRLSLAKDLEENGSIQFAKDQAQSFVDNAKRGLESFEDAEVRQFLDRIADFVIRRKV